MLNQDALDVGEQIPCNELSALLMYDEEIFGADNHICLQKLPKDKCIITNTNNKTTS